MTDAEKIAELWSRLDALNAENASLRLAVSAADQVIDTKQDEIMELRRQLFEMSTHVGTLGTELNKARQAAADSVKDYIARTV